MKNADAKQLLIQCVTLINSAEAVVNSWESGDPAGTVHTLKDTVATTKELIRRIMHDRATRSVS